MPEAVNPPEPELVQVDDAIDPQFDDAPKLDRAHTRQDGRVSPSGFSSFADPKLLERLENDFRFHPAKFGGEAAGRHDQIRGLCLAMGKELNELLPPGREKSLALTSLEETMHWSNSAIAKAHLDE